MGTFRNTPPVPNLLRSSSAMVAVMIGGLASCLSRLHASLGLTIAEQVDNSRENEERKETNTPLGINAIAIGESQTTATLARASDGPNGKTLGPVIPTHNGMGANPNIGNQAARLFWMSVEYPRWIRQLIEKLVILCGNLPPLVHYRVCQSVAGGTGCGGASVFAFQAAGDLSLSGSAVVLDLDVTGPMTFTGLSAMSLRNTAATLPSLLAKTLRPNPKFPRVASRLTLSELPPVGTDEQLREQLLLLQEQALVCHEYRTETDRSVVNPGTEHWNNEEALHGRMPPENLGVVLLRETDWTRFLDRFDVVLSAVCEYFYAHAQSVIDADTAVDRTLFVEEIWQPEAQPLDREEIPSLVAQADNVDFESLRDAIKLPAARISYELALRTFQGQRLYLREVASQFSDPPKSFAEARTRMGILAVLDEIVRDFRTGIQSAIDDLNVEIEQSEIALQKAYRPRWRLLAFFTRKSRGSRLALAAQSLRRLSDERCEFVAKLREIEQIAPGVIRERAKLRRQMQEVAQILRDSLPRHDQQDSKPFFTFVDESRAFQTIFPLPTRTREFQVDALCSLVDYLTLDGFRACMRADLADIPTLARLVVSGVPQYQSPPWGGQHSFSAYQRFYVLPKLPPDELAELRDAIRKETKNAGVPLAVDSLRHGVGVIQIRLRQVERLEEAIPPRYANEIFKITKDPQRDRFSIEFDQSLRSLGIEPGERELKIPLRPLLDESVEPLQVQAPASIINHSEQVEPLPRRRPKSDQ